MQSKAHLYSTTRRTPVGELTLIASDHGLRAILWPKESPARAGVGGRPRRNPDHPVLKRAAEQLDEYFAGTRTTFDIRLDLQGTRFQVAAWRSLARIPFGTTTSYGQQAAALGIPTAARALGAANRANPVCIVLPCHRVIGSNGSLTGFAGGLATKAWLLDHEARLLASPSPFEVESRGGQHARSIVSTSQWQNRPAVQYRLSMPVA
jgi:methylated-DNA-[protein]-cysteine S-methyltransferase